MITHTKDLTKSVQPLKGLSQNFQAFSQNTFNKVTPKNIKLRFMKNNGKEIKKPESNNTSNYMRCIATVHFTFDQCRGI